MLNINVINAYVSLYALWFTSFWNLCFSYFVYACKL